MKKSALKRNKLQISKIKCKTQNTKQKMTEDIMEGLNDYALELHLNFDDGNEENVITPEEARKQIGSIVTYKLFFSQ